MNFENMEKIDNQRRQTQEEAEKIAKKSDGGIVGRIGKTLRGEKWTKGLDIIQEDAINYDMNIEARKKYQAEIDAKAEIFTPFDDSLEAAEKRGFIVESSGFSNYENVDIMRNRDQKQKEFLEYLKNNEKNFDIIRNLIDFIQTDFRFMTERVHLGSSSEIRKWERETSLIMAMMIKKEMARQDIKDDQVDEMLSRIFISMPEFFIASERSHPQHILNEYYEKIQQGDYSFFEGYRKELKSNYVEKNN